MWRILKDARAVTRRSNNTKRMIYLRCLSALEKILDTGVPLSDRALAEQTGLQRGAIADMRKAYPELNQVIVRWQRVTGVTRPTIPGIQKMHRKN